MTECLISPFKAVSEITELCLELLGACLIQHFDFVLGGGLHDPDEQRGAMRQRPRSIAPLENSEEIRDGAAFLAKLTARNS